MIRELVEVVFNYSISAEIVKKIFLLKDLTFKGNNFKFYLIFRLCLHIKIILVIIKSRARLVAESNKLIALRLIMLIE